VSGGVTERLFLPPRHLPIYPDRSLLAQSFLLIPERGLRDTQLPGLRDRETGDPGRQVSSPEGLRVDIGKRQVESKRSDLAPFGATPDAMVDFWRTRLGGNEDLNGNPIEIGYGVRNDIRGWLGFAPVFVARASLTWQRTVRMGFDEVLMGMLEARTIRLSSVGGLFMGLPPGSERPIDSSPGSGPNTRA
jgi:hypothetical protein